MSENTTFNKLLLVAGLLIIFVIPELNNVHYDPQPQFWAEMTVAWGIVGTFSWCILRKRELSIPAIVIPFALFALYLIVQPLFTNVDFVGLSYVTALEMLLCIFLAITANTIKEQYGLKYVVTTLCYVLLVGVILQTLIGFIQYSGMYKHFGDLIFYDSDHPTTDIFGHFGQRNHYAHYVTWGTFGLIYLYHQKKLPTWLFSILLLWMSFSLTIAASRSVFIYWVLGLVIAIINVARHSNHDSKRLLKLILLANVAIFAMEYFYPIIHQLFTSHNNIGSGLDRISEEGTGRRGVEWAKAWMVFKMNPIFGYGWNEYAKQSVLLHHLFPKAALNDGLFTNCHNLILQLLAETGIIGAFIFVGGLIWAIYRTLRNSFSTETIILMCMLATTLAHSMVEYPLWYMYFLAGFVVFLSLDKPLAKISGNWMAGIFAAPIAIVIYLMISGSYIFDNLVNYYDTPDDQPTFNRQAAYLQNLVDHNKLWSYHAIYTLDNYINVDQPMSNKLYPITTQLEYTQRFANFHPYPDTMLKEAMLEWDSGDKVNAERLVRLDALAFPVYISSFRDSMNKKKYSQLEPFLPPKQK